MNMHRTNSNMTLTVIELIMIIGGTTGLSFLLNFLIFGRFAKQIIPVVETLGQTISKEVPQAIQNVGETIAKEMNEKNISAADVTGEYVDTYVRINTKKEVLKQYTELLHKAGSIQDILDVEDKIREIQEELEAKEGSLKLMDDQVGYSTINLTFYQTILTPPNETPGYFSKLSISFGKGWEGLLDFSVGFISAWLVWIILSVIGFFFYRLIRKTLKNTKPATEKAE